MEAEDITVEQFLGREGERYEIVVNGEMLPLTLTEVRQGVKSPRAPAAFRVPFSLFFNGTPGRCCQQQNYLVRDGSGWQTEMFLVPIGDRPDGTYIYQAVYC